MSLLLSQYHGCAVKSLLKYDIFVLELNRTIQHNVTFIIVFLGWSEESTPGEKRGNQKRRSIEEGHWSNGHFYDIFLPEQNEESLQHAGVVRVKVDMTVVECQHPQCKTD